ncbi:squalene--hopene cyclase [Fictibacillus sp. WQ 8-8]|uniref:terpene cyclase/mutase family protein n=1 Tax=Fictibacillus sp. WQ 8-8 TaxID=2938788 RepID=UPI00210BCB05|nr:prenyltransferase/squalene oxidase repeat-containing protein [Fictibacillus sp. WQ 8-8]MCQ6266711.1 squalene--hopene cyclase [Fictibacillus sp. WQ 8-8]
MDAMYRLAEVNREIDSRSSCLLELQEQDGSWRCCFENALMTDAYMIILLRTLGWKDEKLIQRLVQRLLSKQETNGVWKAYPDEEKGNLTATAEAYTALLFSGHVPNETNRLKQAVSFIRNQGGLKKVSLMTKVFFAFNGLYPWPKHTADPARIFRIMEKVNLNFYDISSYARAHFAPVLLGMSQKFQLRSGSTPCLKHLYTKMEDGLWDETQVTRRKASYSYQTAFLENYILKRIEADGTLLNYASTSFLMVYGLISIGYKKDSPMIKQAVHGLISLLCYNGQTFHIQNSPSTIWDTSLINYALLSSGVASTHPSLKKSLQFLLKNQHSSYGDWKYHNQDASPGGWGFSEGNTRHPDVDDTQAALRTINRYQRINKNLNHAYKRGRDWLLSMQNKDGGWGAFEKDTNKKWLRILPVENAGDALTDPSTADLTGRTLEFFGNYDGLLLPSPRIKAAVQWLKRNQENDGSWYGRWGISYIYGTWASVTGLMAAGICEQDRTIQKAIGWLTEIQHSDGGWGESCRSDIEKKYISLSYSTITQTAWALDALITACPTPNSTIKRGIDYLLNRGNYNVQSLTYPTGAGLPGSFYIYYHSYNHVWPLLALCHYREKYREKP